MSLPQTIDPENYQESAIRLMNEFFELYFNESMGFPAQIETVESLLDTPLKIPLLHFQLSSAIPHRKGPVELEGAEPKWAEVKDLTWDIQLVTDTNCGGPLALVRYAGYLDFIIRAKSYYLAAKGLRKSVLSTAISHGSENFYQSFFSLSNQLLLTWRNV